MKKFYLVFFFFLFSLGANATADYNKYEIKEGNENAKVKIFIFESLTCPHCANFHKNIYPNLKRDFIDKGLVQIYFKNFPLDLAALNATKVTHCLNEGKRLVFLHHLYEIQNVWIKGNTIGDINENLKKALDNFGIKNIDFQQCIKDEEIEDFVLNERIAASKKYNIQSTPTIVINEKKFGKPLEYKNLKKAIEKLI